MKFHPRRQSSIVGFWHPAKGDKMQGIIFELAETRDGNPYLIVALLKDCENVAAYDVESRETETVTAVRGDFVGLDLRAALRGLEEYVGYKVDVTYLGKTPQKFGRNMRDAHAYAVELSDKPVKPEWRKVGDAIRAADGAKRNGSKSRNAPSPRNLDLKAPASPPPKELVDDVPSEDDIPF